MKIYAFLVETQKYLFVVYNQPKTSIFRLLGHYYIAISVEINVKNHQLEVVDFKSYGSFCMLFVIFLIS
jgi:hypothetical protein